MPIGLKRGVVELAEHDPEWEQLARETIGQLWRVFGSVAKDIQHVGSTAIRGIKAKPIIDIAVGVQSFDDLSDVLPRLDASGTYRRSFNRFSKDLLYVIDDFENDMRTHQIHILTIDSMQWKNYVNFRDYLNDYPQKAAAYEKLKEDLAKQNPTVMTDYTDGKKAFMDAYLFEARIYAEMKKRLDIIEFEPLNKGWSSDKKYIVESADGRRLLLRVADIAEYDRKKAEYEMMQRVAALGVPMSQPIDIGVCEGGNKVYSLLTWCDGEDAEVALPMLTETEQYVLGLKSGENLRKIHSIPAPETQEDWEIRFNRKTSTKIQKYRECGLRFEGDEKVIGYIEQNRGILANRPQCYQHGDYHVGNMIVSGNDMVSIIDWNRSDYGDPWEEFNRIVWSATTSPYFATGQLRGYFNGEPPLEFFKLLAFYIASNTLSSIYWAITFGQGEIDTMMKQTQDVLRWFDNMQNPVPTWYLKDFHIQYIDGVPLKLKSPFDLDFIHRYGMVFKVFDDQDSGNLCFGVKAEDGKWYFVKFASVPTEQYSGSPAEAIARLKVTVPVYQDLEHPALIKFVKAEEIGGGYAVVFDWVDAECMGRMYPLSRQRFMSLPLEAKVRVFEEVMAFHAHVAAKGYVAIDFYDGSIMYDFEHARTVICDIDFYVKSPYINNMGRLWGSSRFMSPEEFQVGAVIDEVTNVYAMGATAFALFSDYDRLYEKWPLGERLFDVVHRAVSDERSGRQQSIRQLIEEWEATK